MGVKNMSLLSDLSNGDVRLVGETLKQFSDKNAGVFLFPDYTPSAVKGKLWQNLFQCLTRSDLEPCKTLCLSCIRILSRDINVVDGLPQAYLKIITDCSYVDETSDKANFDVSIESMKCLSNILKNSRPLLDYFYSADLIEPIMRRILSYDKMKPPAELQMFDLRIVFLVTTLIPLFRQKVCEKHNGICLFTKLLDEILSNCKCNVQLLNDSELSICSEVCMIQFNLLTFYLETQNKSQPSLHLQTSSLGSAEKDEITKNLDRLMDLVKHFLMINALKIKRFEKIQTDVINLLTVIPHKSCIHLISGADLSTRDIDIKNPAMKPIKTILSVLDSKLTDSEKLEDRSVESLSPILMALLNLSKSHWVFRKYCRKVVLPHLRDVFKRPEEGNTLRNKLCRLLTSPATSVSDLAASWLFVLCKEKVSRMIKYTGYGNSAGLFARHGFPSERPEYSSDSEDSDTEEYLTNKEDINPVVGCKMPSHPDPMKDMTEEQKEHLVMELVNSVDKLQRGGIIQPCRINKDGKPEPLEHVNQLQEQTSRDLDQHVDEEEN